MRSNRNRFIDNNVFVDLILNILLGFALMFLIAFLFMRPPTQTAKIDPKAEYMVVMTWPDGNFDDIDLWMMTPRETRIGYPSKRDGLYHLERDDLGIVNDVVNLDGGPQYVFNNKEVIVLRGAEPGLHLVNIHFFSRRGPTFNGMTETDSPPLKVVVTLIKLNPTYHEVVRRELILHAGGAELAAFQFTIDDRGNVVSTSQDEIPFVRSSSTSGGGDSNRYGGE
jgi:hypothetical protein